MNTGFKKLVVLALPLLFAAACADDEAEVGEGFDANMPVPADTGMYAPPPPPMTDTMGMMGDTMAVDTMGADTTPM